MRSIFVCHCKAPIRVTRPHRRYRHDDGGVGGAEPVPSPDAMPSDVAAPPEGEGNPSTRHIVGHAAIFDAPTAIYDGDFYAWSLTIMPGAFASAIAEAQDVRALFNHNDLYVLGRTAAGTLALSEDAVGLLVDISAPDTPLIRDLVLSPIQRGDITGMSFAWTPRVGVETITTEAADGSTIEDQGGLVITRRYEGGRLIEDWVVKDVDLVEVSPTAFPAFAGTDVAVHGGFSGVADRVRELDRPHSHRNAKVQPSPATGPAARRHAVKPSSATPTRDRFQALMNATR